VPITPKVHILNGEVGGHQQLVSRRNAQHGAVIAYAGDQRRPAAGKPADLLNQLLFAKRHIESIYLCFAGQNLRAGTGLEVAETGYGSNLSGWTPQMTLPW
jgi:hypothetical protein